ncbi:MAG: GTP-binding protein [Desulfovibrionaceae bacterium]|nr:GTP-binding protein [Desulfovibrionaceae bacterium]
MINKKICMLGAFSVGKTALVQQYVHSIFSDKYLSSVGVKISKKDLNVDGTDVTLVLWDMEGKDLYVDVNISYLRGAMGYFLVVDGKRKDTLQVALELRNIAVNLAGPQVPHYILLNKADLEPEWEINEEDLESLRAQGISFLKTSAKSGMGVEEAFMGLAKAML